MYVLAKDALELKSTCFMDGQHSTVFQILCSRTSWKFAKKTFMHLSAGFCSFDVETYSLFTKQAPESQQLGHKKSLERKLYTCYKYLRPGSDISPTTAPPPRLLRYFSHTHVVRLLMWE